MTSFGMKHFYYCVSHARKINQLVHDTASSFTYIRVRYAVSSSNRRSKLILRVELAMNAAKVACGKLLLSLRPSKVKLREGNGDRPWTTCPRIEITSSQIAGPRKTGAAEPTPWEKGARIRSSSPFASKLQSVSERHHKAGKARQGTE